uniref:Uncharacterized protein n=1 Tax=Chenopodium quinoa TaxID=63459 RepID=A0A803LEN6_CHEQI
MHSLFFCMAACSIWRMSMFENLLEEEPHESFVECWKWLLYKVIMDTMVRMAALMWAAWRCRNLIIFENASPDAVQVAVGFWLCGRGCRSPCLIGGDEDAAADADVVVLVVGRRSDVLTSGCGCGCRWS